MTQNESPAPAPATTDARGDYRAEWVMPSGARTSGTFLDTTPDRVRAALVRARDVTIRPA